MLMVVTSTRRMSIRSALDGVTACGISWKHFGPAISLSPVPRQLRQTRPVLDPILASRSPVKKLGRRSRRAEGRETCLRSFDAFTVVCSECTGAFRTNLKIIPPINQTAEFTHLRSDFQCKSTRHQKKPLRHISRPRETISADTETRATKQFTKSC